MGAPGAVARESASISSTCLSCPSPYRTSPIMLVVVGGAGRHSRLFLCCRLLVCPVLSSFVQATSHTGICSRQEPEAPGVPLGGSHRGGAG